VELTTQSYLLSSCNWSPSGVDMCNDGCHADDPQGLPHSRFSAACRWGESSNTWL
jgi:hypothetical protein